MQPTLLETREIQSCSQAPEALKAKLVKDGHSCVPVVLKPQGRDCCCCCFLEIPKGFQALVTSEGNYIGIRGESSTLEPPWVVASILVPERDIIFNKSIKNCVTKEHLMATIDISVKLRVMTEDEESLRTFCYNLGPRGLDLMLTVKHLCNTSFEFCLINH